MGHELQPKSGALPSLQDIIEALHREFRYVRVDREIALRRARAHAIWIRNASPQVFLGRHAQALAHAAMLEAITSDLVLWIEFGDGPGSTRDFSLWPGESIKFGYRDADDEKLGRPMIDRCARALDCETVKF
jgi:hypothetical protein